MVTIKLQKGVQLDCVATARKMNEAGFEIDFTNYPASVNVKLTPEGDKMYPTDEAAQVALSNCFVEEVGKLIVES